jgi:hypothetical protein
LLDTLFDADLKLYQMNKIKIFGAIGILAILAVSFTYQNAIDELPAVHIDIEKLNPGMSSQEFRSRFPDILLVESNFNSFEHINPYNMKDVEDKSEIISAFKNYYEGGTEILKQLTKYYGSPSSHTLKDSVGFRIAPETPKITFIDAKWELKTLTIHLTSKYNGKNEISPSANMINAAEEPQGFEIKIELKGTEKTKIFDFFQMGETAQEMEKRNPAIFKDGTGYFGSHSVYSRINGLDGNWEFCFKNGELKNAQYYYSFYENSDDKLTKNDYENLNLKIHKTKDQLEEKFGMATSGFDSIPQFNTLNDKNVNGSALLNYEWKLPEKTIRMNYGYQYGGKGMYYQSLSFHIQITDTSGQYDYCY